MKGDGVMAIRLTRIEQSTESGMRPGRGVQFGEAYLCELLGGQCEKAGVESRIVVVVQSMELCKNATEVYVAPVMEGKVENAFSFRIEVFNGDGVPAGAGIDLAGIKMIEVGKLGVRLGRLGARDLWRLDEGLKDIFGAGSNWSE